MDNDRRIVKLKTETGWQKIEFKDLKIGNQFQLFEPDGKLIGEYTATNNAFQNSENLWTIEVDDQKI